MQNPNQIKNESPTLNAAGIAAGATAGGIVTEGMSYQADLVAWVEVQINIA